ncbi:DUF2199 domain-containing protein [Streptomyces sp. NPDC057020]|uniref:DUF2199 domain-containing protein n=1 Tax=unclassified Streptomyces TaxID=2593676 RepID=UPI0036336B87
MTRDLGFTCSCCGAHHPELPMNYSTIAPDVWDESFSDRSDSLLSSDQCVIQPQHYGHRPRIELEPTEHPLAVEQRTRITLARVREIAETVLHATADNA